MIIDDYTLTSSLGKGTCAEVFLTSKKGSSTQYATKLIDKSSPSYTNDFQRYLENEISILQAIDHPNILKCIEVKNTENKVYIVTEYCNGGTLENYMLKHQLKDKTGLSEEIVQHIMKQVVNALDYLSNKKIMHRHITLDNLMINYENEEDKKNNNILKGTIKLIDFGFSRYLKQDELAYTVLGSPINMSPLLLTKLNDTKTNIKVGYTEMEDVWSLGTVCFELLIGKPLFDSDDMNELTEKMNKGDYYLPITLSKEAISFIKEMLQFEPKNRSNYGELKNHKFLTKKVSEFSKVDLNGFQNSLTEGGPQILLNIQSKDLVWIVCQLEAKKILEE